MLFIFPVISACWSFLTPVDGFGISVLVGSAWIYFSLVVLSLLLLLSLYLLRLLSSGSWCSGLGALLCWLDLFLAIFRFPGSLGSILGDFGWLAYLSLA